MNPRFVVHEHDATHLHYDFRLEINGSLRSWAIPKGPSMNPSEKRLAVQVTDHPMEYIGFEGIIPQGHYGAGSVVIWDNGTYESLEKNVDRISFILNGKKLKGKFTLVRFKAKGETKEWLLIKQKDEHAMPDWKLETSLTPTKLTQLKEQIPPCKTL